MVVGAVGIVRSLCWSILMRKHMRSSDSVGLLGASNEPPYVQLRGPKEPRCVSAPGSAKVT